MKAKHIKATGDKKASLTPSEAQPIKELRELRQLVHQLRKSVDALIQQQGCLTSDLGQVRRDMFTKRLKSSLRNKRKLKKEFDASENALLKKCGVKNKILTIEDVERIKSRVDMQE